MSIGAHFFLYRFYKNECGRKPTNKKTRTVLMRDGPGFLKESY